MKIFILPFILNKLNRSPETSSWDCDQLATMLLHALSRDDLRSREGLRSGFFMALLSSRLTLKRKKVISLKFN